MSHVPLGASVKSHILFLGVIGVLGLSGCETFKGSMRDVYELGTGTPHDHSQQVVNVETRADRGDMAPMPIPSAAYTPPRYEPMATGFGQSAVMANDSVSVFPQGGMPGYGAGVANFDSSVEIFPLDGPAPMMGGTSDVSSQYYIGGQVQGGYQGDYQGNYSSGGTPFVPAGRNQVYFNNGSSRLGNHDRNKLSDLADEAKFAPVNYVTVSGHASRNTRGGSDSVEGQIRNLKQSMDRSFAVSRELIRQGVPGDKIKTVSWGAAKATGTNTEDRRVDIIMGEQ